jgi:hypothetical protein
MGFGPWEIHLKQKSPVSLQRGKMDDPSIMYRVFVPRRLPYPDGGLGLTADVSLLKEYRVGPSGISASAACSRSAILLVRPPLQYMTYARPVRSLIDPSRG